MHEGRTRSCAMCSDQFRNPSVVFGIRITLHDVHGPGVPKGFQFSQSGIHNLRGSAIDCVVRDLSATGAALEVTSPVGIPEFRTRRKSTGRAVSCFRFLTFDNQTLPKAHTGRPADHSRSPVITVHHVISVDAWIYCAARRAALSDRVSGAHSRLAAKVFVGPDVLGHRAGTRFSAVGMPVGDRYQ
jgi:hypothetical protein